MNCAFPAKFLLKKNKEGHEYEYDSPIFVHICSPSNGTFALCIRLTRFPLLLSSPPISFSPFPFFLSFFLSFFLILSQAKNLSSYTLPFPAFNDALFSCSPSPSLLLFLFFRLSSSFLLSLSLRPFHSLHSPFFGRSSGDLYT